MPAWQLTFSTALGQVLINVWCLWAPTGPHLFRVEWNAGPGKLGETLSLQKKPRAPSSFLFLAARSSVLVPSSDARSP